MKKIPLILIYSRLVFGFVIIALAISKIEFYQIVVACLIIAGLLTDIFDGIVARRLGVSNQQLRRLDSSIDQVFWICTLVGAFFICSTFFKDNLLKIAIVLALEGSTYIVSYWRFRKEVATHAIASKIWTLTIMATLLQVVVSCSWGFWFEVCFYLGILTRIEIIAILLIIKEWTNDIPSIYHAILLRKGKSFKRNKLFNG